MGKRFLIYGLIGLLMEILWTGIGSFFNMDLRLICHTSFWMLPIYGMVVFLEPLFDMLENSSPIIRGGVYAVSILMAEYLTGTLLNIIGVCPWDYSGTRFSINGIIRLDYAPLWAAAGLFFEFVYKKIRTYQLFVKYS